MEQINRQSPTPLYEQLKLVLRDQIFMGTWTPGTQLPSEQSFCEMYKVSRITVARALSDLEREGFVMRIQGKGTIVTQPKFNETLARIRGYSANLSESGKTVTSKILSIDTLQNSISLSNVFQIPYKEEEVFIRFRRLRFVDGVPATIMTSIVRQDLGLRMQKYDLETTSFYWMYENILGLQVIRNEASLFPVSATREAVELLNVKPGSAHFLFRGVSFVEGDIPIELSLCTFHGGMFTFSANIYKLREESGFRPTMTTEELALVEQALS